MYSDDVLNKSGTAQKYDYEERSRKAEQYFAQFEEGKSLVFYYAGYSNPFSENEENNYVVAGISRLKKMGDFHYYQNISEEIRKKYAGGIVWQKPVTSAYPDEGGCMVRDMEGYTGWYLQDEGMSLNKLWTQALKKEDGSANPEELQIISPYRGEFYGTDALNQWMQSVFNTYWSRKYNLDGVSPFDKVIQFRNRPRSDMAYVYNDDTKQNERAEVFNGEIGIAVIHGLDYPNQWYKRMSQLEHIQVRFSNQNRRKLRYNYGKKLGKDEKGRWIPEQKVQENLELAYAISVHKSQGSEFDYVYIVIPKRDSHLLSMELLYTAITRAQKHVTIFLQDDIGTLTNLGHLEKSAVRRINSSIFEFKPLPEELLYTHNWHADEKKLATLSEYFVRSKSEVIIANMLVDRDIPFKYEEPLYAADGTMYLPDFTVTFRGETYYWEHVGMLYRPDYKAHWEKKQKWYEKNFPGQLLVTYEGKNLSQDALEIIMAHS